MRPDVNLRADFLNVHHHAFSEMMTVLELWILIMPACERAIKSGSGPLPFKVPVFRGASKNILIVGDMGSESHWPMQEFPRSPVSQY
jgi:hypothetical protein